MNSEEKRAYYRAWVAKNRDRIRSNYRAWAILNRDRIRKLSRESHQRHRDEENKKRRLSYKQNPEKWKISNAKSCAKLKREVFDHYGSVCQCCGETEINFLTIDHIAGNGKEHRSGPIKLIGSKMYRWLRKNGYPSGFQVLCWNCNVAKGLFGCCPHKKVG